MLRRVVGLAGTVSRQFADATVDSTPGAIDPPERNCLLQCAGILYRPCPLAGALSISQVTLSGTESAVRPTQCADEVKSLFRASHVSRGCSSDSTPGGCSAEEKIPRSMPINKQEQRCATIE